MDLTGVPEDIRGDDELPPDFNDIESPDEVLKGGPIRERLLDIVVGLRAPTKVSRIADLADCDPETARDYLEWFAEMGLVRERSGRPVRYERNDSYFWWRRIDRIRETYSTSEIVDALTDTLDEIEAYRAQFDAEHPDAVSLVEASTSMPTEEAWEALSTWQTLERRAALLDAARRNDVDPEGARRQVDV